MIRRLVEELERTQLELQELRHDMLEEKKKNKNFQNLLEEMVFQLLPPLISGSKNKTAKRGSRQGKTRKKSSRGSSQQSRSLK
jgi:hypothetical protein